MQHQYNYKWELSKTNFTKDKGKVFSCFSCGGGSTMGYKLAGFDVIGCNEIDNRMMQIYMNNHHPKYTFLQPIQDFKKRNDLPEDLYHLDILDGSPPCSTFSMSGSREKAWGKMKHFREGQAKQMLDTLFFDFIDLAKKLQPKVVVAENVKGLLLGNAIKYVHKIYKRFDAAGYYTQHFLLDASKMGVPQRRKRVFFLCLRKDLATPVLVQSGLFEQKPKIILNFNEAPIVYREVADFKGREITSRVTRLLWENRVFGDTDQRQANIRLFSKPSNFNQAYIYLHKVSPTLVSKESAIIVFDQPKYLSKSEVCSISTFPQDYNFGKESPHYVCGMSVPPVMMANIAREIYNQWLTKI